MPPTRTDVHHHRQVRQWRAHPYLGPQIELAEELRRMEELSRLSRELSPLPLAVPIPFQDQLDPQLLLGPWVAHNMLGLSL